VWLLCVFVVSDLRVRLLVSVVLRDARLRVRAVAGYAVHVQVRFRA
jgi:hypothetical protein